MKKRVQSFIEKERLLAQGERIIVGVSGGADSMCLLLLLKELCEELRAELRVVHVHHGIRGEEADADEQFVRGVCEAWKVPLTVFREDVPTLAKEWQIGLEEAGRRVRYRCFAEEATRVGAQAVCVAHHKDDVAETVLFRLLRGTGLRGMLGIPTMSHPFSDENVRLVRPLLCVSRREIEEYLQTKGVPYRKDSTNESTEYDRNYIRKVLLPACERINAEVTEHIAAFARQAKPVVEWMDAEVEAAMLRVKSDEGLSIDSLSKLPEALRNLVLLRFLQENAGTAKDITERHVEALVSLINAPVSKEVCLPYGMIPVRGYSHIFMKKKSELVYEERHVEHFPSEFAVGDGEWLEFSLLTAKNISEIPKNQYTKWFDYDKIKQGISIRTRRAGDYLVVSLDGRRKRLQDVLVDRKVPRAERERALVATGDQVLWFPGCRSSEAYRVSESTMRILQIHWRQERK